MFGDSLVVMILVILMLSEGPRGPMVSYCGTLTGFHSAPSQPIVSRRREHALDVLELEHGDGNMSHQVLRSGLFSNVLPSPPMVVSTLQDRKASGQGYTVGYGSPLA